MGLAIQLMVSWPPSAEWGERDYSLAVHWVTCLGIRLSRQRQEHLGEQASGSQRSLHAWPCFGRLLGKYLNSKKHIQAWGIAKAHFQTQKVVVAKKPQYPSQGPSDFQ